MIDLILSFISAFCLTYLAIPSIINIARKKNLVDEPGARRSHNVSTPSLGGIGIFTGVIFSVTMWTPFHVFSDLQYILCSFIIIFLIGAKDDIDPISPGKKLIGQIFAASILVFKANIKLSSMYGLFGIYEVPELAGILITIFTIIVIINSFNLIDGINGLSGGIGVLMSGCFGYWFYVQDHMDMAIIATALIGSVVAFLRYNITPARIFMGDTGSLFLGLIASILAINFIEFHNKAIYPDSEFLSAPAVAISVLIIPLFDTLRVFTIRILMGRSPFTPDKNHIHHIMLRLGFNHMASTGILLLVNILFIILTFQLQHMGNFKLIILILAMALCITQLLHYLAKRKSKSLNA